MDKIIIKEIDQYKSKIHGNKSISEYLIYIVLDNGQIISAYSEIGEEAKKIRVNELIIEHFYKNNNINIDKVSIEETSVFKNKKNG